MAWAASLPEVVAELAVKEFAHLAEDDSADESGLGAKAPRLDYETVANKISTLESPTFKACDSLLTQIVAFRGTAAEEGSLLKSLKSHWPDPAPTLADLRTTAKERRKQLVGRTTAEGLSEDIEKALINECLAEHYQNGSTIRRVAKLFWTYESGLWSKDDSERVEGALQSTLLRLREERPEDTAALVAAAGDVRTSAVVRPLSSMMARLLAIESVRDDPLGLERRFPLPIINCLNCEIYLTASGKIDVRDHNPANFYTTRIDCEYSADAPLPREWMRFCKMIFSEYDDPTDMQRHLEEMMGYIIQKSRWLRSWILFHGPTGTGKTTVGDVLKSLLGRAALETDIRALDPTKDKFAFMGLIGKLMVIDDDMTKGALLPDGTLKKLSEEKAMWTDIKYGEGVSFINRATPVLLSNHWPATRDLSDALRDRALVFEFNHQIVRKERSDERKVRMITRERAGILRRLVNALSRLRARGDFKVPAGCRDAHAMWVQHSNPLTRFLADCVVLKDEIPLIKCAKATDVWHSYTTWSISNVDRRYRLTKGSFYESMGQLGVLRTRSRDGTFRMAGVASVSLDEDN